LNVYSKLGDKVGIAYKARWRRMPKFDAFSPDTTDLTI